METITSIEELNERIIFLEAKQVNDLTFLKEQFQTSYESIKPINFIKNTIKELIAEPNLKEELIDTSISMAVGYLSKTIVAGRTKNPTKQFLGTLLQIGVTSIVFKNADSIKSSLKNIINKHLLKT
jgi:hypothetical protein